MEFHHLFAPLCLIMLLIDPPELAHLPEDQAHLLESFIAPSQSKILCLKWISTSETVHRSTGLKLIHLFLRDCINWNFAKVFMTDFMADLKSKNDHWTRIFSKPYSTTSHPFDLPEFQSA